MNDRKLFRKTRGRVAPPGLEQTVLRRLPLWTLGGTVVPALVAVLSRVFPAQGSVLEVSKHLFWVDALAIGAVFTVWTAALTIAIGCIVVAVMKGPRYEADSYPLSDASRPSRRSTEEDDE